MLIVYSFVFQLSMVPTQRGASGSGSGTGVEPIDARFCEFITSEMTYSIMEATPMIFGTVKERIMELLDE